MERALTATRCLMARNAPCSLKFTPHNIDVGSLLLCARAREVLPALLVSACKNEEER
jgi:hypothetical protein